MDRKYIDDAKEIIEVCTKMMDVNPAIKDFCEKIVNTMKTLLDNYLSIEKTLLFSDAKISYLENVTKQSSTKDALLKVCLGEDVVNFLNMAAKTAIKRYSENESLRGSGIL